MKKENKDNESVREISSNYSRYVDFLEKNSRMGERIPEKDFDNLLHELIQVDGYLMKYFDISLKSLDAVIPYVDFDDD